MDVEKLKDQHDMQVRAAQHGGTEDVVAGTLAMVAQSLADLFRARKVPQLYVLRLAAPGRWLATRRTDLGHYSWPTVHAFNTWEAAIKFIDSEIAAWCRNELVRNGYSMVQVAELDRQGHYRFKGWRWQRRRLARAADESNFSNEDRVDSTRITTHEDDAWRAAWHHYKRNER